MKRCPCCGYLTINDSNYKLFGATEERFLNMVGPPHGDEI